MLNISARFQIDFDLRNTILRTFCSKIEGIFATV